MPRAQCTLYKIGYKDKDHFRRANFVSIHQTRIIKNEKKTSLFSECNKYARRCINYEEHAERDRRQSQYLSSNKERDTGYQTTMWRRNKIDISAGPQKEKRDIGYLSGSLVQLSSFSSYARWYATRRTRVTYLKCCRDWACFVSTLSP